MNTTILNSNLGTFETNLKMFPNLDSAILHLGTRPSETLAQVFQVKGTKYL